MNTIPISVPFARNYFSVNYSHTHLEQLEDETIETFLNQSFVIGKDIAIQMDLLYNHILSQGLTDVTE